MRSPKTGDLGQERHEREGVELGERAAGAGLRRHRRLIIVIEAGAAAGSGARRLGPRLLDLVIDDSRIVEGVVELRLDYLIRSTNSRFNLVFPFYLGEATEAPGAPRHG